MSSAPYTDTSAPEASSNTGGSVPLVSIILLDWSVRERFFALEWLNRQTVDRSLYELIWVELYTRRSSEVESRVDRLITCQQSGMYHKHVGYNEGLLAARGKIICVCDSDAVFPPEFVGSILGSFFPRQPYSDEPESLVLMHYEYRTKTPYPDSMQTTQQLGNHTWLPLWPNVGACMSVRRTDALRFGGFDEHEAFRGYMCGPYDLGWRLINAGIPERWHPEDVALWHFAHPDPVASTGRLVFGRWREIRSLHVKGHAALAVEAFSTGRILPQKENPRILAYRLRMRVIGTPYEEEYAHMTGPQGFGFMDRMRMRGREWLLFAWRNLLALRQMIFRRSGEKGRP